jgi:hypothetical protein
MVVDQSDNQTTTTDSNKTEQEVVPENAKSPQRDDWLSYSLLICLIGVTLTTFPTDCIARVTLQKVWYFGWITAVSTGLGVLPFYLFGSPSKYYMGIANGAYFICLVNFVVSPSPFRLTWISVYLST